VESPISGTDSAIVRKLREWKPEAVAEVFEFRGQTTIVVPREHLLVTCEFLANEPALGFKFLSHVSPVDRFPLEPRFEINYHLLSLELKQRLGMQVKVTSKDPVLPSVTPVWPAANWHEREAFDLFGVRFEGHPELTRILMPDDWEGYPLRKDYPVEGIR
jgi:NADH-quinone oxidoreductase subunit C